jgi:predicted acylesterase/phospholipase RssA
VLEARDSDTPYLDRFLASYSLDGSLFQTHELKTYLMELFDPEFYGRAQMETIVEDSLKNKLQGSRRKKEPKTVGSYSSKARRDPINVGIAVADTATGKLEVVPPETEIVEGLLAAVSVTPFFPPKKINGRLCIDGTNVTSEPMDATFKLLRGRVNKDSPVVHMYSVTPFPVSSGKLGKEADKKAYHNLVDVVLRALRLQRFRDATLERRLTELFTRSIPAKRPEGDDLSMAQKYFRAWVTPIELDTARGLNRTIFRASVEKRQQVIREAIVDGCRASLQVMIHESIKSYLKDQGDVASSARKCDEVTSSDARVDEKSIPCAPCLAVVKHHLKSRNIPVELADVVLPGQHDVGPGLREICEYCTLCRATDGEALDKSQAEDKREVREVYDHWTLYPNTHEEAVNKTLTEEEVKERKVCERWTLRRSTDEEMVDKTPAEQKREPGQSLRLERWKETGPPWPHEREYGPDSLDNDPHFERPEAEEDKAIIKALRVLKKRNVRDPNRV